MKVISFLGLLAAIATAVTAQVTALNPKYGAWVMLAGAVAASTGGALSKYLNAGPVATGLGIIVAVAGVLAMATNVIPASYAQVIAVLGTAAAAAGKSLFGWEDGGAVTGSSFKSLLLVLLFAGLGFGAVGCAKFRAGETAAETTARKKAVYGAQAVTALQGWSDLTLVIEKGGAIGADGAKASYAANEKALTALDLVRSRVKQGYPSKDILPIIDATLDDLDKAEAAGLFGSTPNAQAKLQEVLFSVRFGFNSIKAVIAATQEPSIQAARAVAQRSQRTVSAQPPWWQDAVLVAQNVIIKMLEQSRMDAAAAWTDGDALSTQLHARNAERLK